ncbi:MAG: glycosyltransferase [Planctomycetes bacterium]|nr:glycosyltransferase [Planctomycetota bacterium]
MSLRVLHIDTEKGWRGGEQQALNLATGLARRGVATLCVGQPDQPYVQRCAAAGLDVAAIRTRGEADPVGIAKLRGVIRSWRPDVVHMHTSHAHTLGVIASRSVRPRPRTVVSRRVDFTIYRNALRLSWFKYRFGVDRYVAISRGIREQMVKDGIPAERIRVVHSGIDLSRFDGVRSHDYAAEFGLAPGTRIVLDVAAFGWHKAQEVLVRAAPEILRAFPATRIVLVGEGECMEKVRAEARALGVEREIVFTGFRNDVPSLLAGCDCFVMCSVLEGLCTSLLDALALRRAAVGSAVGGIPEVLLDGSTGLLVPPRDPAALAAAVVRVLGDGALAARLGDEGRRHVERDFTTDSMVEGNLAVYRDLLAEGATR